jgi:hypothetical protein
VQIRNRYRPVSSEEVLFLPCTIPFLAISAPASLPEHMALIPFTPNFKELGNIPFHRPAE